jgi:hypothetical protein
VDDCRSLVVVVYGRCIRASVIVQCRALPDVSLGMYEILISKLFLDIYNV